MTKKPTTTPALKYELTYWLRRNPISGSYYYKKSRAPHDPVPLLCGRWARRLTVDYGEPPANWIKLTLSPFPRAGYTQAKYFGSFVEFVDPKDPYREHVAPYIVTALYNDLRKYMPMTFWFKLEVWK